MRKYLWIVVIALVASAVYFTSCERIPTMMDPLLPDAEQIEPPEPEPPAPPEEIVETPADTEMTAMVKPDAVETPVVETPAEEPESPEEVPVTEPMPPPTPVAIATVEPPSGSRIAPDTTIDVTFDGIPADLTVSTGELSISDANATITGPFMAGSLTLNLIWADGIQTLRYVVEEDVPPPPVGMVAIPAGDFEMGTNNPNSTGFPAHTVWVDAFYMDIYEVTNLDYKRFVLANPQWEKRNHGGGYLRHWDDDNNYPDGQANYPVQYVNWYAAAAYAAWVGKRLPTEAEWEKAARGGLVGKLYPLGDTPEVDSRNNWSVRPVGTLLPNAYGLHNMGSNVSEFCLDHYDMDFYASSPERNPLNGAPPSNTITDLDAYVVPTGNTRIVVRGPSWRGGSWSFGNIDYRRSDWPGSVDAKYGIRCVQDVPR